jgi:hypothetical protein
LHNSAIGVTWQDCVNKTCNVYISKRQNGPRGIALFLFLIWTAPAAAHSFGDHPFKSGFVSCEAALTRSLTTLLDETFKNFRTASTAGKVKALHLVAEVANEHARTRRFSEGEQLQLGLLLKSIAGLPDREIQPFATELLFIALKLTVNSTAPKISLFEASWEQFLKRVMSFETPGYSAHRAAVFGTLAMLEAQKMKNGGDPLQPLERAFSYVTSGWAEDYEIALHPTLMVIEAALNTTLPEEARLPLDLAMAGAVTVIEKSLAARSRALDQERFSQSYLWLLAQVEIVSRSPGLMSFPEFSRKMAKLRGSIAATSSSLPN